MLSSHVDEGELRDHCQGRIGPQYSISTAESLKYICTMILIQPDSNTAAFLTCCMVVASSMTFMKNIEGEEQVLRA